MPPVRISLGSCQLMFVVTCFAPDAPASENAKAPEMKARRPKSSLPPMLGTESKYLFSLSRQPQDWGPAEASASLPTLLEVWPLPSPECPVNYWRPAAFSQSLPSLPHLPTASVVVPVHVHPHLTQAPCTSHKTPMRASPNVSQVSLACQVDLWKLGSDLVIRVGVPSGPPESYRSHRRELSHLAALADLHTYAHILTLTSGSFPSAAPHLLYP